MLAFIAGAVAIAPAADAAVPLASFVLALDGPIAAAHAPYLHAAATGAYASAGLAVSIRYPEAQSAALVTLVSGGADACVADATAVLAARASGANVTIVASVGDLHPACVVSRTEAAIATPGGLAGKRVAVDPLGTERLLFPLFLAASGLRAEDVMTVPLDEAGREAALAAGTVDALLDRLGNEQTGRTLLPWAEHGFALYGPCIAVRDDVLRSKPAVVRAFLKATMKTWEACLREPAAAAESAASSGLLTREAVVAWLEADRFRFDTETYRKKGLGWIEASRMTATLEAVRAMVGRSVAFAAADAFTTSYLPVPAVLRKPDGTSEGETGTTPLQR